MPRLLKFRPLCDQCERAEALFWCLGESLALCEACDTSAHASRRTQRHRRVPIGASSVVSALCARCVAVPAATFLPDHALALCELCAREVPPSAAAAAAAAARPPPRVPLRDSHVAGSIVFDKMDFSALVGPKPPPRRAHHRDAHHREHAAHHHHRRASPGSVVSGSAGVGRPAQGRKRAPAAPGLDPAAAKLWRWLGANAEPDAPADCTRNIDLSYFKTTVPASVASAGVRRGSRGASKGSDPIAARVAAGRTAKGHASVRKEKK